MNASARPSVGRTPSHGEDAKQRQEGRSSIMLTQPAEERVPSLGEETAQPQEIHQ